MWGSGWASGMRVNAGVAVRVGVGLGQMSVITTSMISHPPAGGGGDAVCAEAEAEEQRLPGIGQEVDDDMGEGDAARAGPGLSPERGLPQQLLRVPV